MSVIAEASSGDDRVIGVVRVYETARGTWYGGRLGVDPDYRRIGNIGKLLIVKAVTTAHAWGATSSSPWCRRKMFPCSGACIGGW